MEVHTKLTLFICTVVCVFTYCRAVDLSETNSNNIFSRDPHELNQPLDVQIKTNSINGILKETVNNQDVGGNRGSEPPSERIIVRVVRQALVESNVIPTTGDTETSIRTVTSVEDITDNVVPNFTDGEPRDVITPQVLNNSHSENVTTTLTTSTSTHNTSTTEQNTTGTSAPEPSTQESSTSEPSTPEPSTPEPNTPEPSTPEPSTPEPSTPEPSTPEPSTPEPSTPEPSTPEPSTPEPSTPEPSTPEPSTPEPSTPEPSSPEPSSPEPTISEPEWPSTEQKGSSEPTSEPETTVEPSAEPENPISEPEGETEPPVFSERQPDFKLAKGEWKWAWEFMIYFFGIMFFILAVFSGLSVVRLWSMTHLISRNYFVTLNVLIIIKCLLRSAYLLVDAYNVKDTFSTVVHYFLYSTAFPCLTSAFSILFYALLLATKMQVISPKVQKLSWLIGIIVFHFALSIITDVLVGYFAVANVLLLVCQFFYILWGLVLFIGYFYLFKRLLHAAVKRQKSMCQQSPSVNSENSHKIDNKPHRKMKTKYTIGLSIKVTFLAAFFGLFCVGIELFGVFGVFRLDAAEHTPQPWPWYIYQFSLRLMELLMCVTMLYVASQPIKYQRRSDDNPCLLLMLPCQQVLCGKCGSDTGSNSGDSWNDSRYRGNSESNLEHNKVVQLTDLHYLKSEKEKAKKKSKVTYASDMNGKMGSKKPSHLVIEDGLVRFRSTDDIAGSDSEIGTNGTSLPDLLNGNVPHADSMVNQNGVLNSAYNRTDSEVHKIKTSPRPDISHSTPRKPPRDMDRASIGTTGTTDTLGKMSNLDLAASLEWEFEQAFERSFGESDTGSVKSLPNVSELSSRESSDLQKHLLCNTSPTHDIGAYSDQSDTREDTSVEVNRVSFDLPHNNSSLECPSPTRKPLIKKRQSSYDHSEDVDPYSKFKINIYNS